MGETEQAAFLAEDGLAHAEQVARLVADATRMEAKGLTWPFVRAAVPGLRHDTWNIRTVSDNPATMRECRLWAAQRDFLMAVADYVAHDDNTQPADASTADWYMMVGLPSGQMPTPYEARAMMGRGRDKQWQPELVQVFREHPRRSWNKLGMTENPRWWGIVGKPWLARGDEHGEAAEPSLAAAEIGAFRQLGISEETLAMATHLPRRVLRRPSLLDGTEYARGWEGSQARMGLHRLATLLAEADAEDAHSPAWARWARCRPHRTPWPTPAVVAGVEEMGDELARLKLVRMVFS